MKNDLAIYIHWPFCKSKCPYCDFNSHVRENIDQDSWETAYLKEIDNFKDIIEGRYIGSIFFGGGTPSLMPPIIAEKIIDKFSKISQIDNKTEITLEANPTSVEIKNFKSLKSVGINRVSLGIQSLNSKHLEFLGRNHSANEAKEAISFAREIFNNYSFDLIYTLPNQTLGSWEKELTYALEFAGNHLSLYQLTIEKGTKFYSDYKNKKFSLPNDDESALFYQLTQDIMNTNGLPAYEISNHAKAGYECKHNLAYWKYKEYLGIGPGAHSRINNQALIMIHHPENWLEKIMSSNSAIQSQEDLNIQDKISEILLMGLRLNEGINLEDYKTKLNVDLLEYIKLSKLQQLQELGLLEHKTPNIVLTPKGFLVTNKIISELLN
ncbi:MAG: radical SAM family heme chaperone HemW [Alphaproteobacteria bacterium]